MDIRILHFAEGAAEARGLAVVIDVFRAFSVACYAFDRGASEIIATDSIDYARQYKRRHPSAALIGERHARKIDGFDYGNSPSEILSAKLDAKTIVHTTHAGTRALVAAEHADDVITASFVNVGAVIDYIRFGQPETLSLICAGHEGRYEATEDTLCARYIQQAIAGTPPSIEAIRQELMAAGSAARFFDPEDDTSPEIDFDLCLAINRFPFVIRRVSADPNACRLRSITLF